MLCPCQCLGSEKCFKTVSLFVHIFDQFSEEFNGWLKAQEGGDGFIIEEEASNCKNLKECNEEAEGESLGFCILKDSSFWFDTINFG